MSLEIGRQRIGDRQPLFVIAELGLNHGGSLDRALQMVDAAAAAGASAVKLQSFSADELVAGHCPAPAHVPANSLQDFFRQFELDRDAHVEIARRARRHGLAFVATPFSCRALDMLVDIGVDAIKIASGDLTYDELIACAARTGLPIIISTGMSTLAETAHAVSIARGEGANQLALLHCVSSYPVLEGAQNLRVIETLARVFGTVVGLSDHARDGFAVPIAVTLGASIYERHFILPGDGGVDRAVSSTPDQLAGIVAAARRTQAALGHGRRECLPTEAVNLTASRRALHTTRALAAGEVITAADVVALRPSRGLPPNLKTELVGTTVVRAMEAGAPFLGHDLPTTRSQRGVA
jgi:N,N'-diacetyllegionaminate synthase